MVSLVAKWLLTNSNIDPLKIARVTGVTENECWQYLDELNIALRQEEKAYDPIQVQKEMREWKDTIPDKKNIRIEVLRERLINAKTNPENHNVEKILHEIKVLKGEVEQITPQDVVQAKAHPIENLITTPIIRGTALCPLHVEKTPSFSIKKNKWVCYGGCGHGDSIDLYMKLNNIGFIEAVKRLK